MVNNEPTQRPAPNLLDSLIIWHWKVKGISQRSKVRIPYKPDFFRPSFRNWKNCPCNCDDLLLFRVQLVKQKHQSLAVSWANGRSLNVSLALVRWGCAFNHQVRAPLRSDNVFATCGTSVLKLLDEVYLNCWCCLICRVCRSLTLLNQNSHSRILRRVISCSKLHNQGKRYRTTAVAKLIFTSFPLSVTKGDFLNCLLRLWCKYEENTLR